MVEKSEGEVGSEKGRGVETANDMSRVYLIIMSSTACPLWGKCILAVTLIVALVEHVHRYIDVIPTGCRSRTRRRRSTESSNWLSGWR